MSILVLPQSLLYHHTRIPCTPDPGFRGVMPFILLASCCAYPPTYRAIQHAAHRRAAIGVFLWVRKYSLMSCTSCFLRTINAQQNQLGRTSKAPFADGPSRSPNINLKHSPAHGSNPIPNPYLLFRLYHTRCCCMCCRAPSSRSHNTTTHNEYYRYTRRQQHQNSKYSGVPAGILAYNPPTANQ